MRVTIYMQDPALLEAIDDASEEARLSRSTFLCRIIESGLRFDSSVVPYRRSATSD
jgi:hypothetical protein